MQFSLTNVGASELAHDYYNALKSHFESSSLDVVSRFLLLCCVFVRVFGFSVCVCVCASVAGFPIVSSSIVVVSFVHASLPEASPFKSS